MAQGKCKKASSHKDINVARATTLKNKVRKFETICRRNPHDHCARNTLAQLRYNLENGVW